MTKEKISILYIDDEAHNLTAFKANFRNDYQVFTAETAFEGLEILKKEKVHILITDQRMPKMTGIQFLESVIQQFPDPIRMILTGYSDIEAVMDAINKGQVYRYLLKPFEINDLKITINNAYEVYKLKEDNQKLTRDLLVANKQLEFMIRQKIIGLDMNSNNEANLHE